jgi:hypothetical protein
MYSKWVTRILQVTVITITLAAICQEMEKPKEERRWHGKVAGFIPYDFRVPTLERLKEAYWNPYEKRILTPEVFGIGWAINFYSLLDNLGLIGSGVSEEDFLMPTQAIKDLLAHHPPSE